MVNNLHKINCAVLNSQSVRNKTVEIRNLILEHRLEIFCLTETWLDERSEAVINEFTPSTHTFYHIPRVDRTGGGVGICLSNTFYDVNLHPRPNYSSFEGLSIEFKAANSIIHFIIVYRPPSSSKANFLREFIEYLSDLDVRGDLFICGDLI